MDNAEALRALEILADMAHMEAEEYAKAGGGGRVESLQAIIRAHLTDPGYVRVPVEPTEEMLNAAIDAHGHKLCDISRLGFRRSPQSMFRDSYRAMLAAARLPEGGSNE